MAAAALAADRRSERVSIPEHPPSPQSQQPSPGPSVRNPAMIGRAAAFFVLASVVVWGCEAADIDQASSTVLFPHALIRPRWLKKEGSGGERPLRAEIQIQVQGRDLLLQIERNEHLFASGYREMWYSPSGELQTSTPPTEDHCFYHGSVLGLEQSGVVLSTCGGLRGLIVVNSSLSFMIKPLKAGDERHVIYQSEHTGLRGWSCGHQHLNSPARDRGGAFQESLIRDRRDTLKNPRYVELFLVADHTEFQNHKRNYEDLQRKLLDVANYVDKFYRSFSIRVALIGLEIWTDQDKIVVSENPYNTLSNFLSWRRMQFSRIRNDNAQLITGVRFSGSTIGLAPLLVMCSEYQSGGINSDYSQSVLGVASTVAHEMGHNFGLNHDSEGCCTANPDDGGCIMAKASGHPFPKTFNQCNKRDLKTFLDSGGGKCLSNMPNTKTMYGGQRCGNGYLEEGEECDCGEAEECTSACCNANNCTLKVGAECAHGECCDRCKLLSAGTLCRSASGSCDLPEYCTGSSEFCPANFYLLDGTECNGRRAYCYSGMCLSFESQCASLWGQGAEPAPAICFEEINKAGDMYGNCGKNLSGQYKKCQPRDAKCGKIQCLSSADSPLKTNVVAIDTGVWHKGKKIKCRGTHVYQSEMEGDTLDPGLVMTGTKCGDSQICFNGECRNLTFLQTEECLKTCHGHGLCNNIRHCHCDVGWSPPFCDVPGGGGSVDSGPVSSPTGNLWHLLWILVVIICLAVLGLVVYKFKDRLLLKLKERRANATPKEPPVPGSHANPLFVGVVQHRNGHNSGATPPAPVGSRPGTPVAPPPTNMRLPAPPAVPTNRTTMEKLRQGPPSRPPPPCPIKRPQQDEVAHKR
ncbi:disintegrin and metalloproteinase domain-containing protein 19 isoform X1 [Polypterus senegalus]|uniref:disintegrin and metalloproteinase domain-containing protein 19 isoform X1 n=1 Tax=Polypterus senegalus TaxID=55291 RepID=UPI001962A8E0|nr:disintegrin and metalloproteinase domain-containing protein 19 isoform X1 [Polypterus senegalus]